MAETSFKDKVAGVNKTLVGYGDSAITSHTKGKGANEKTYTGYKIQYVVDAVNEVIGAENWRWEASNVEAARNPSGQSSTANVAVTLYIRVGDEWLGKGPVTGDSLNPVETDAMKGALSDGLKKSFAYWSIGNKAYRGELDANDEKKSGKSNPPAKDARLEDEQKAKLIQEILAASKELNLSDERREGLKKKYTAGKDLNEASLDELDKLFSVMLDLQNQAAR